VAGPLALSLNLLALVGVPAFSSDHDMLWFVFCIALSVAYRFLILTITSFFNECFVYDPLLSGRIHYQD
jgi:hypothetical protein